MESRYDAEVAAQTVRDLAPRASEPLALRTYTARLVGQRGVARPPRRRQHVGQGDGDDAPRRDRSTSSTSRAPAGTSRRSSPQGHPAVRLAPLRKLRALDAMTDEAMVNELRTNLLDASAPNPSVETLLHAFLPARFIDHTHADAILALVRSARRRAHLPRDLRSRRSCGCRT